ncbi:MAG: lysine--tRNA ligase [Eubacteriales bacterium]
MSEQSTPQNQTNEIAVRRDKLAALCEAGQSPFWVTRFDVSSDSLSAKAAFESAEQAGISPDAPATVTLAGRMVSRRIMGKAAFVHLLDHAGKIQLYVKRDEVGEDAYAAFKKWDLGDIIGVGGFVFRTQSGEVSLHVTSLTLLAKSLLPLPEKFHGLTNTDLRYRQRYVDLIVNPDVRDTFVKRSKIIREIRRYLDEKGFLEVETPVLHNTAGGASARPFLTHHNTLDLDMHLRIALELHLKRLIVGGFAAVYEIGRVFRNEGMDNRHNPEFTLLELYRAYTDYRGMMDLTEDLIRTVAARVLDTTLVTYDGVSLDLSRPFARLSMTEAVRQYAGVDFDAVPTTEAAKELARAHGIPYEARHTKGDILSLFFERYAEEHLMQPTFITEYPVEISPLAKRMPENPAFTERFELFIVGREHANAFSELNDPLDQRARFEAQAALKAQGDEEACDIDEDFLTALSYGMPPTGGLGIGIDRLVMLLTDTATIRDVLLFPTMKPLS